MRLCIRTILVPLIVVAVGLGLVSPAEAASPASSVSSVAVKSQVGAVSFKTATNYNWNFQGTIRDPGTRFRMRTWKSRSYLMAKVRAYRTDGKRIDAQITYAWTRPGRKTLRAHSNHWGVKSAVRLVERKRGYLLTIRVYAAIAKKSNVVNLTRRGTDSM